MAEETPWSEGELHEPPVWPKAIGITSIIVGGLFVCCGACGLVQIVRGPQQMPEGVTAPPQPPMLATVMQVVGFFLSLVLLVAGILLVNRKEAGRWLHLIYAILAVPAGVLGLVVSVGMLGAMRQWVNENPKMQQMSGMIMGFTMVGMAIAAIPILYNVFLLIWFGVVKRKADLGAPPEVL
jgi:cytochrome bd-type quinol oxidase subunit 1